MSTKDIDVPQEPVTDAEVTVYKAPSTSNFHSAKITGGICTNAGLTDSELTVYIVRNSVGAAAQTNIYFPPKMIFAGEVDYLNPIAGSGLTLKTGDFIVTKASVSLMLNFKLSIVEKYLDN